MREPSPLQFTGESGSPETRPAEAATELGVIDTGDVTLPLWELVRTLLLVIVVVGTAALIAALI